MKKNLIFKALIGIMFMLILVIGGQIISKQNEKINKMYEKIERQETLIMSYGIMLENDAKR